MTQEILLNFKGDIRKILLGLEWDPNEEARGVMGSIKPHNLDLSCAIFDNKRIVRDVITPQDTKRDKYGQKIFHKGDNKSGGSDFEDEEILINLDNIDDEIPMIGVIVSTNDNVKISDIQNGRCSFLDASDLSSFLSLDLKDLASNDEAVNVPKQQHFLMGVIKQNKQSDCVIIDHQMILKSMEPEEIEAATQIVL
ncbi:MAG: TerD family protein [Pseudomonadota bacterium]